MSNSEAFLAKSTVKAADLEHRRKINFNIEKYNSVVPQGKQQFSDIHLARERAKNVKWRAIETLDQQLEEFDTLRKEELELKDQAKQLSRQPDSPQKTEQLQKLRERQHDDGDS